jgi:uroporphyrinogen-III decarboxylase
MLKEVRKMRITEADGFVFATIHNILANVPPKNIIAMYEALREFRESEAGNTGTPAP